VSSDCYLAGDTAAVDYKVGFESCRTSRSHLIIIFKKNQNE
jgi:hypothetical protein